MRPKVWDTSRTRICASGYLTGKLADRSRRNAIVADLGLLQERHEIILTQTLQRHRLCTGTIPYMKPKFLLGSRRVRTRRGIYTLAGVTLYQMLSGKRLRFATVRSIS